MANSSLGKIEVEPGILWEKQESAERMMRTCKNIEFNLNGHPLAKFCWSIKIHNDSKGIISLKKQQLINSYC